ncbi:Nucleotide-binding alpha-beta plait [Penicillium brevicompactum]|uniref:Nucleotide-binding alpha-beta plait n=1 Tax=Penicillium brevicompactum TaxID=5074 RepID=A0A9W9QL03_PENBR|nr:Nucleotide-binding alpha-beta plait [Penicillium brevicompactum]
MPFLGRDKGRSRSRRSDDEFVVFLQGIPSHCRWQELKDLVRQTALHIRQAVVYDDSHGFPTGLGQIIIKNEDEAWRTYHRLSTNGWEGQSLVVTLSRTSTPTKPIAGPTRSPSTMSGHSTPPRAYGNITMPPSPVSPEIRRHDAHADSGTVPPNATGNGSNAMLPPSPSMNGYEPQWMMPYPMTPQHSGHTADQYFYPPPYKAPDPQSPSFFPDCRTVTLDNLHPSTTPGNLKELVSSAGIVTQCNMALEIDQTRASITMQTNEEAQRAVTMFNNTKFMGSRISVRLDRGPSSRGSRLSSSGTDSLASEGGDSLSWADEMCGLEQRTCKPLVIDGSGKSRSDMLCTSAPT